MFPAAHACGGLFCATTPAQPLPVIQNAERIAFVIDDGHVEAHVQVFYEGPPDEFAWVVPVPADVEVFVSHDELFDVLDANLAPTFRTDVRTEGRCGPRNRINLGCGAEYSIADRGANTAELPVEPPVVTVESQGQVGPYEYLVLSADSETALVDYLDAEGFDFDASMGDALAPYVVGGGSFLAFRLSKDNQVGDIQPIGFRYPGDVASVPIQLTAIAAAADMGIQINVFGDQRAVSTNYLHVDLDPAALDWTNGGFNFFDLVARGVDEAGGHAFVTEYAGPTPAWIGQIWTSDQERLSIQVLATTDEATISSLLQQMDLPPSPLVSALIAGTGAPAEEIEGFLQRLDDEVFEPRRRAEAVLDHAQVTRLATTLDPSEMTLDPRFVLHPDAPVVEQERVRELVLNCTGGNRRTPVRESWLDDGRVYLTADPMERVADAAVKIWSWSEQGPPELVYDGLPALEAEADTAVRGSCGCAGSPWEASALVLLTGLLGLRRRRLGG